MGLDLAWKCQHNIIRLERIDVKYLQYLLRYRRGAVAFFLFALAIIPSAGRRKLGGVDTVPEFSNFSWCSMMFGASLGVGLMVFATAEPLGLLGSNPVILDGTVTANSADAVESAYRYTFLHYGFHAWAIYVVTGLSLAYYAYTRDMPLTIRSALTPLFGASIWRIYQWCTR